MNMLLRRRLMMDEVGGSPTPPPTPQPVFYDRLVFDGTAWIHTDLFIPTDGSIAFAGVGYEAQKVGQHILKLTSGTGAMRTAFYETGNTSNTYRVLAWRYADSSNQRTYNTTWSGSPAVNLWMTPFLAGAGNSSAAITAGSDYPVNSMDIGGPSTSSSQICFTGRAGILRIFDDTAKNAANWSELIAFTPVYTLKPCTYLGEAGLWCVETSTFYGNSAGAGQLSVMNN